MQTDSIEKPTTVSSLFDKGKLFLKAIIIFFMAVALWLPTNFIQNVVSEREARQQEAIADINSKWAGSQTVTGPILTVPYIVDVKNDKGVIESIRHTAFFIPDNIETQADVVPEKRHRGIYEVVVYKTAISMKGTFNHLKFSELKVPLDKIIWSEARLQFHVSDNLKGINEDIFVNWNNQKILFTPLPVNEWGVKDALTASLPLTIEQIQNPFQFAIQFSLNGSEELLFAASARENKITMRSSWKDPSFTGVKLPDVREVNDSGFVASWKYMNRAIPMVWSDRWDEGSIASMGAGLTVAVDSYDKTTRSVKYALLCIILTFAAFFLIESIYKKPLHLVQYGLAGLALVLFYTLLLSISEYTGFNISYAIAGVATIGLVTWYVGSIMQSRKLAIFISFVLTVVYGYIFTIIQLQDFSLLMGSIGLFIALAIIMFFSRKLQW